MFLFGRFLLWCPYTRIELDVPRALQQLRWGAAAAWYLGVWFRRFIHLELYVLLVNGVCKRRSASG